MFAVRHPALHTLWFDFEACTWTFNASERTTFTDRAEAAEYATLPTDGGVAVAV